MIPRHARGLDILIRLLLWGSCLVVMVILSRMAWEVGREMALMEVMLVTPPPEVETEERRSHLGLMVVFVLSLLPLFWPRVPWGLVVFGVIWVLVGGLWVDTVVWGIVFTWLLGQLL